MLVQNPLFYDITPTARGAQSLSSDSLLLPDNAPPSGVDTAFSQRSSISSYYETGHLFYRPTSQNSSVFSSDCHLLDIDLNTDQYSTSPTPNLVDYHLIVNGILVNSSRQDPRFLPINLIPKLIFPTIVAVKNFNVLTLQI